MTVTTQQLIEQFEALVNMDGLNAHDRSYVINDARIVLVRLKKQELKERMTRVPVRIDG